MRKNSPDHASEDSVSRLSTILQRMEENSRRRLREATEFKPGELTEEEEEFVEREGLNALNYIPQKVLQEQADAFQQHEEKMHKRAEILSRPQTDPERIQLEREERVRDVRKSLENRFDGFGYGMFLFVIFIFTWSIIEGYGWLMGIFSGLLMFVILELSYRLYARH